MNTFAIQTLFLGNLRGWEWIIILGVILLLFGGKKIPQLMRGLGKGVHSFKEGLKGIDGDDNLDSVSSKNSDKDSDGKSKNEK